MRRRDGAKDQDYLNARLSWGFFPFEKGGTLQSSGSCERSKDARLVNSIGRTWSKAHRGGVTAPGIRNSVSKGPGRGWSSENSGSRNTAGASHLESREQGEERDELEPERPEGTRPHGAPDATARVWGFIL